MSQSTRSLDWKEFARTKKVPLGCVAVISVDVPEHTEHVFLPGCEVLTGIAICKCTGGSLRKAVVNDYVLYPAGVPFLYKGKPVVFNHDRLINLVPASGENLDTLDTAIEKLSKLPAVESLDTVFLKIAQLGQVLTWLKELKLRRQEDDLFYQD